MKKVNATFFDQKITNSAYGKLADVFDTKDKRLSALANHAAFEYIVNGDRDFLDHIFQSTKLLLNTGELNPEGRKLAQYIAHFAPISVTWKKEEKALVISKTSNKKLKHCFFTGEKKDNQRETVPAADFPQWPLTMQQVAAKKDNAPKKESVPTVASPKALANRVGKLSESLELVEAAKVSGADLADLHAALSVATAQVSALLEKNVQFAREQNAAINGDQSHEYQPVPKPSGASKRANIKRGNTA